MDGCTKGPQLEEGENLNTRALRTGRTPLGGTSAPAGQAQGGPSPTFVKENIDSGKAGSENSQMSPSAEEVGGYSSDGSSRSRSRGRPRTARKHQKSVSRKKGASKSYRSIRSEARSRSKSKSVKSKPQSVRASRRKSSSDSGYDTVSDSGLEDLSMPYRRPKPMPFTSRITHFRYHRRAKLSPNVRVYEGNKDPEDHLSIFSAVAEQEKWPMPVWCKMSCQTLSAEEVRQRPNVDTRHKRNQIKAFKQSWTAIKFRKGHTSKEVPSGGLDTHLSLHGHPELAKKLNDKIPKTVDEMWERVRDTTKTIRSPRWEKSVGKASWSENQNGSRNRSHRRGKEILAMDNVNFPPPLLMVGTPEKRNMETSTEDCSSVKDIRKCGQKGKGSAKGKEKVINMMRSQGYRKRPYERVEHWMDNAIMVRRIHVDGGSSSEVMYERCFRNLSYQTRSRLRESRIPLVGFSREAQGAVASTIHSMMKFPTSNGITTISTTRETLRECRQIEEAQYLSRHARVTDPSPMQTGSEVINPRVLLAPRETHSRRPRKEPMQLDHMEEIRKLDKMGKKVAQVGVEE
ncbi:hypothetical protein Tco_0039355 [Tanacetum coccineum]